MSLSESIHRGAGTNGMCRLAYRLLLPLLLLFSTLSATASALHRLSFDQLGIEQGLPSTGVQSLYQSRQGYIWLGTSNGLVRYDGLHMKIFASEPGNLNSLSHSRVFAMLEDDNSQLWVGSRRGLDKLDLHTDKVTRLVMPAYLKPKDKQVYAMVSAGKGQLWVASSGGLLLLNTVRSQFTQWQPENKALEIPNGEVHALISDGLGGFWFGQGTSVIHIDQHGKLLTHFSTISNQDLTVTQTADRVVRSLGLDGNARLWVGMNNGLKIWTVNSGKPTQDTEQPAIPLTSVIAIVRDQEKTMWLATGDERGLYRWTPGTAVLENFIHLPSVKGSLSGNSLTSLMQDQSGSLWIGTSDYGVNLVDLNGHGFSSYLKVPGDDRSLSHELVKAVIPDDAEHVWIGTRGGGLNRLNLKNGNTEHISQKIVSVGHIMALLPEKNGQLWVAGNGLQLYNPKTNRSRNIGQESKIPASTNIYALAKDHKGNLWAGSGDGLYRISPNFQVQVFRAAPAKKEALNDDIIFSLMVDKEQRLWVGSNGALHLWNEDGQNFTRIMAVSSDVPAPEKLSVTSIKQDSRGRIWLATEYGLLELKTKGSEWQFKSFRKLLGTSADLPEAMQIDSTDDIWLSTERGLIHVQADAEKVHYYSSMSNFYGAFNFGAAALASDGSLLFGGVGLIHFHPKWLRDNPIPPNVILSDILLFNKSLSSDNKRHDDNDQEFEKSDHLDPTNLSVVGIAGELHEARRLTLNHQQSMISFEFSALHFYHHDRNHYAWKLEGSDREWIYGQADQSIATYTNLNPGHYRLLAKAANPDGIWSESKSLLEVEVLPPFWRTWWWYLGWTISALVILSVIYRHRVLTAREARQHLEDQVRNRTQEVVEQKIVAEQQRELAEKARHDIGILSEIGRQITASLDPQAIQQTLYQYVKKLVNANTLGIGIVDWNLRTITFNFLIQNDKPATPYKRSLDAVEQPSVQCVINAQELNITNFTHDGRRFDKYIAEATGETEAKMQDGSEPELSRSGLYVPMTLNKKVIGVIALLSDQPHAFDQNAVVILRTLSAYAAVALENAESYRRLQLTQDKLVEQEKLAALGSLVAGVAHELNTPIGNSVLTASTLHDMNEELLKLVQSGKLRRSSLEIFCNNSTNSVDLIVRNLDNAARLITSFKQIAVDQTSDKRRLFDLKTVCNEVAMTLSNRLKREGHELRIDVEEGLQMDSYPGSFGQVLSNLIINAIVHGLSGREHGLISLKARAIENDQVKLIFNDNGRGIDAAHIDHVFEPFFTTRLGQGGSGLGLHISYNIICSVLGGSIDLSRSPGEGATFTIFLPLVAPQQKEKLASQLDA